MHIIADRLYNDSDLLWEIGDRDEALKMPHGRGDEAKHGGGADQRDLGRKPRDIFIPDLRTGGIKVKKRDFR